MARSYFDGIIPRRFQERTVISLRSRPSGTETSRAISAYVGQMSNICFMRCKLDCIGSIVNPLRTARGDKNADMDTHDRLRLARERAGFETAAEAARRFGWPIVTYRHHENGTRGFKQSAAVRYARAFHVTPEWILLGTGLQQRKHVPVVGYIGPKSEVFPVDGSASAFDSIDPPPGAGPDAKALLVRGESMWPRYADGDVLIYDHYISAEQANGLECIVALTDGRRYVKNLRLNPDGTADLESWNAPPIRNVEIDWIAPIIWVRRG